jgi:tetratricopeptide (TPR) repeat protein
MRREVAVKILHTRFPSRSEAAIRFVEEAQIAGQLQHPGIPAVYHVGHLADGRPFLAMRLIQGRTLDDLQKDGVAIDGLAVFEAVSQAVGYAHAHGVVHRDLKPHNIMVGSFGEVQVMDWGLAKVLAGKSPAPDADHAPEAAAQAIIQTLLRADDRTQMGTVLGTPAYMAPEQAAGQVDQVDQRADVFGLGAVLCALLTGQPPISGATSEMLRLNALRGKMDEALSRLEACAAEPAVVALCKQCLSFDPAARPVDGNAVAQIVAGLRRAADERARQAELDRAKAEVSAAEQTRRRRILQWAGGAVTAILTLGIVGTSIGLYLANAARKDAVAAQKREGDERKEAVAQANLAKGVREFLQFDVLLLAEPAEQHQAEALPYDAEVKLRDVVLRAAKAIDGKFADQPRVEAEIRYTLAYTLAGMGRADLAVAQYQRARDLLVQELGRNHPETLGCDNGIAICYHELGQDAEAAKLHETTLRLRKQSLGAEHHDTLQSMYNLARCYATLGKYTEALKLYKETLSLSTQELGPEHSYTIMSASGVGRMYTELGDYELAETWLVEALSLQRRVFGFDHPETLVIINDLAGCHRVMGRHSDAINLLEETLTLCRNKLGPDHPGTRRCMAHLANTHDGLGQHDEALQLRERVLAIAKQQLGSDHPDTALAMNNLANSYFTLGRREDAMRLHEETLLLRRQILGADHPATLMSMNNVATCYLSFSRHSDALQLLEQSLLIQKQNLGVDHPDTLRNMNNIAAAYADTGRHADALNLREETLALRKQKLGLNHADTLFSMEALAKSYAMLDRAAEAMNLHEETLTLRKESLGLEHPDTLRSMHSLAQCYFMLGRSADALALFDEAQKFRKEKLGPDHSDTLNSSWGVVTLLVVLDRVDEAFPRIEELLSASDRATASGKWVDPQLVPTVIGLRMQICRAKRDVDGCRTTAEMWEKHELNEFGSLYGAARYRAITAAVQAKADAEDATALAAADADLAMNWLSLAVSAGFEDHAMLEKDADFNFLRDREDFKALLAELKM